MTESVRRRPALRTRLVAAFAILGGTLALTYVALMPLVLVMTEDRVFTSQLELELERLGTLTLDEAHRRPLQLGGARIWEPDDPDASLQLPSLGPGIHELNDVTTAAGSARDLFVGVTTSTDDQPLTVVWEVTRFEEFEGTRETAYVSIFALGLVVTGTALSLSWLIARRLFRGLDTLRELASRPPTQDFDAERHRQLADGDEIDRVASAFVAARARADAALVREQRFTRDASHELRTPITIARGALDVVRRRLPEPSDPSLDRAAGRIEHALDDMHRLVQTFLWLAREPGDDGDEFEPRDLFAATQNVVELARAAHGDDVKRIALRVTGKPRVEAPDGVLSIVLGNLVRNALSHSPTATPVTIDVESPLTEDEADSRVTIVNHADPDHPRPNAPGPDGFGFGLQIVAAACTRFGWTLHGPERADGHVTTSIAFATPSADGK